VLVTELTEIDGSPAVDEDMLEMDLQDLLALIAKAVGNTALSLVLSSHASSTSSSEQVNQRRLNLQLSRQVLFSVTLRVPKDQREVQAMMHGEARTNFDRQGCQFKPIRPNAACVSQRSADSSAAYWMTDKAEQNCLNN
jgi:hypothetical protein